MACFVVDALCEPRAVCKCTERITLCTCMDPKAAAIWDDLSVATRIKMLSRTGERRRLHQRGAPKRNLCVQLRVVGFEIAAIGNIREIVRVGVTARETVVSVGGEKEMPDHQTESAGE